MAKTLVGLYDTLTDAEQVVHDLGMEGFPRGGIRVAAAQGAARRGMDASVGEWITVESGTDMVDTLTDLGVPADEAEVYAEAFDGGALVIVESSDEWADRGLDIMHRRPAVDMDERTAHWRQEGWRGTAARTGSSPAANVHPKVRQERPRTGTPGEHERRSPCRWWKKSSPWASARCSAAESASTAGWWSGRWKSPCVSGMRQ